jgi:ribosome-associated toxin RatA of RatAB toxin-antitoxin module
VRSLRSFLAVLLLGASAPTVLAAEGLRVEARRADEGVQVRAEAQLEAPVSTVWEVLTDYERLPAFIPGITRSVVRERRGNQVILEQSGEARFLVFSFPVEVTYEVTETPETSIACRALSGNLKRMTGRYDIQPAGGGGGAVRLRYSGFVDPDFNVPDILEAAALRSMVEKQFTALVAEIERRAARPAAK